MRLSQLSFLHHSSRRNVSERAKRIADTSGRARSSNLHLVGKACCSGVNAQTYLGGRGIAISDQAPAAAGSRDSGTVTPGRQARNGPALDLTDKGPRPAFMDS